MAAGLGTQPSSEPVNSHVARCLPRGRVPLGVQGAPDTRSVDEQMPRKMPGRGAALPPWMLQVRPQQTGTRMLGAPRLRPPKGDAAQLEPGDLRLHTH